MPPTVTDAKHAVLDKFQTSLGHAVLVELAAETERFITLTEADAFSAAHTPGPREATQFAKLIDAVQMQ